MNNYTRPANSFSEDSTYSAMFDDQYAHVYLSAIKATYSELINQYRASSTPAIHKAYCANQIARLEKLIKLAESL